ncbi:PEP-CTERM sorting domain-containing protein [Myxococcota bacterium]|nr:PEP-CTERM sorting domain-containing protein [Myxococcota bacterium]
MLDAVKLVMVPEPGTIALLALGIGGLAAVRRVSA